MDPDIRTEMAKLLKKQGMEFRTSTKVTKVDAKGKGATVTVEPAAGGKAETITADVVLVSIGRKPNNAGVALEKEGLAPNNRGQLEMDRNGDASGGGRVWKYGMNEGGADKRKK